MPLVLQRMQFPTLALIVFHGPRKVLGNTGCRKQQREREAQITES